MSTVSKTRLVAGIGRSAVCLIGGIGAALLSACSAQTADATAQRPVMTVEVVSLSGNSWPDTLVASGEVAPWQEASVGTEIVGVRLEEVLVDVGDVVRKNQLLARYSEDSLRAELAQLDAQVAEAAANLANAKADAVRADSLEATSAISRQAIFQYRTQAAVAEARLAAAKAFRDAQALRLKYARVVAPDDGVISSRSATVGAIGAVGTELFRLVRRGRLEWRAEVPAEQLAKLDTGIPAVVDLNGGASVNGTLRLRSPTVDAATRNGIAYVDLPADSGLAAGMYVTGRFIHSERNALSVPESAIVLRDGNQYLMKVGADDRIQEIKVRTGRRQNDAIEVLSEIAPTDRFVKSGGAFISHGDLVKVTAAVTGTP
ncbi:MAG: efflux RND transporter periplasmic adaptor subunit [Pseudomonadota bacterium]|nr:efflux RND transporter periplasmic adaptor subunit [Pseudomonadota bacterium]